MTWFRDLSCGRCESVHDGTQLQTTCGACGGPLLARYELPAEGAPTPEEVRARAPGQFRFHELQPTIAAAGTATLGEGATPLVESPRLASHLGVARLLVKDESQNPTHSFKARGMAAAVARAAELGAPALCLPTAGNAGAAASAYGALHGLAVHVAMPRLTPDAIRRECLAAGALVQDVDGTIADAGRWIAERALSEGWFDLATLREPYRIEGKKVMGQELFLDLRRVPDVVVYPTGGGTGLIGMAKAFDELQALGWIGPERPRFVSVQTAGCAPIVRAFQRGDETATPWAHPGETSAFGLRVPGALGDFLILRALRETDGAAVAVTEEELEAGTRLAATSTGLWMCPEGGACVAAAERLARDGWLRDEDEVVLFNTGSPLAYL